MVKQTYTLINPYIPNTVISYTANKPILGANNIYNILMSSNNMPLVTDWYFSIVDENDIVYTFKVEEAYNTTYLTDYVLTLIDLDDIWTSRLLSTYYMLQDNSIITYDNTFADDDAIYIRPTYGGKLIKQNKVSKGGQSDILDKITFKRKSIEGNKHTVDFDALDDDGNLITKGGSRDKKLHGGTVITKKDLRHFIPPEFIHIWAKIMDSPSSSYNGIYFNLYNTPYVTVLPTIVCPYAINPKPLSWTTLHIIV